MKLGVYGGTFDPPHLGHMVSARQALEALELDKLLVVPAPIPPHNAVPEGVPLAQERLEMTAMAADTLLLPDRMEVSGIELDRQGPSYTSDTLRQLRQEHPGDELWLLMGSDMFLSLHQWHEPETVCALAHVAVFARSDADDRAALEVQAKRLEKDFGAHSVVLDLPQVVEISSTQIRADLAQGIEPDYLPEPVYGYILRHGLYGVKADLKDLTMDQLRACSLSMVYAKRHAHIRGVEGEAVRLARRWGADEDKARRAGILHDCTKYLNLEEQLAICEAYNLPLDALERENAKLLHSKTGAALAWGIYGQEEEVCRAIYWHTTGKPGMTVLEKIIYIADYMEPNRDFAGVEDLRRLAYEDLDAAVLLGLQMSAADLTRRGLVIHSNTQGAIEELEQNRKGHG